MANSAEQHLLIHLRDAHAIELQALRQLGRAVERADDESRSLYEKHLERTKQHEQTIKELIEAHDHEPSPVEDKTFRGGAIGLRQLSDIPPDTPTHLAMHVFALEHLEIVTYELLGQIAEAADDSDAREAAERILEDLREGPDKVASTFDRAAELLMETEPAEESLKDVDTDAAGTEKAHLLGQLREAHALEQQSLKTLEIALDDVLDDEQLERVYREHFEQTQEQDQLVNDRIEAQEAKPSAIRDLQMTTAKVGLRDLTDRPPDAAVKVAMNVFCLEQLEVAAYEFLIRIAKLADDGDTAKTAEEILEQEREAAEAVRQGFGRSVELMLQTAS